RFIKLHLDDLHDYDMEVQGFQGSVIHYTTYFVEDVELSPNWHSYYFEADDGFFIARSSNYEVSILNSPPIAVIVPPSEGILKVRQNYQFSAEGSSDPDGDQLTYSWDFDDRGDGLDRDAIGKAVGHTFYTPGVYNVTLTVSDGKTETHKTIIVTVIDEVDDETFEPWLLIGLVAVLAVLIIAVVLFIVLSKKGHEEQHEMTKLAEETWDCPECGRTLSKAVEECPACGYEYDPLDFEDEDQDEM
ncbi:MAG: PKD domain-containing protein, partial [Thermoplasmatota archaeon]